MMYFVSISPNLIPQSKWRTPLSNCSNNGNENVRNLWRDKELSLIHICIGGLDESNVDILTGSGAQGGAVVRAIVKAQDPEQAARRLREKLDAILK